MRPQAPELKGEAPGRITPRDELVNLFEVEAMAKRKLPNEDYALIAGSDRRAFDRITLRPRVLVNVENLDLTTELFGERLFAPMLVGPMAGQHRFHPEAELETVRGAAASKTAVVVSSHSNVPFGKIAAQAKTSLWYQAFPEADPAAVRNGIDVALASGAKALCITLSAQKTDWNGIDRLRKGISVPVLLKGIMSASDAKAAVERGIQGIAVSNYGAPAEAGLASPIEMLPSIADAVSGKIPILIDGSFRRGTDILKALALGARAVLVGRPILWGLAAYGAGGVQAVLSMLQSELARDVGLCGRPNLAAVDRSLVKIHKR